MSNYDFSQLSPHDFELICRDLLQAKWQIELESFKTAFGDQAARLRRVPQNLASELDTIVPGRVAGLQCKPEIVLAAGLSLSP